ncbi:MAG: 1,4-dihydroxy-2-naphthoate octaprenyltransferase [Muribaculaceae bacterium]|nr:1,4-dihydroxy-2-naphthoate octaprenyltransferase [Muribaculaceae bacterium]
MKKRVKAWIEAMRLRTLPASLAGVITAAGLAAHFGQFRTVPLLLCMLFALLAQISSNFANEYYDFRQGLDKKGREGFRRGVTEGDITPGAMKAALFLTLGVACCIGLSLTLYGGLWLIAVGVAIAVGVIAYSAGPYPLSQHGLGEVAAVVFFGLVPVNFTYYLCSGEWNVSVFLSSLALGLMISNIMIVNNYRDADDDRAVGKHTLAVMFGRRFTSTLYLINGYAAVALTFRLWYSRPAWLIAPAVYLLLHTLLWYRLTRTLGARLNPLLGMTAMLILTFSITFAIAVWQ